MGCGLGIHRPPCLIIPPGARVFILIFWSGKLRLEKVRSQGHWAGLEWRKWIEVTTGPPRSGSKALLLATLQVWLSKDLLWVTLKGRAKPNGLVIPGYGFWVIYPFSTLLERLLCARHEQ